MYKLVRTMPNYLRKSQLTRSVPVVLAALLLGAVSAHWVLELRRTLRPAEPASAGVIAMPTSPTADPAQLHLFGMASNAAPVEPAAPPPNLALTGVVASGATGSEVALLTIDGKPAAVRVGDLVAPGLTVNAIERDRVVLNQNGQPMNLLLTPPRGAAGGMAPVVMGIPTGGIGGPGSVLPGMAQIARPGMPTPGALIAPSAPFKLNVSSIGPNHMAFSKNELNQALQDPKAASALGNAVPSPGGQGLLLNTVPAGSLPEKLGLQAGDVLKEANGQAMSNLTDLPRLYQVFGTSSEVRLEITRSGQPMILQFTTRP